MTDDSERLVVVLVVDETNPTLTGRTPLQYTSPAQPREHALALVELLLGHQPTATEAGQWRSPLAGGRRTITLREEEVSRARP